MRQWLKLLFKFLNLPLVFIQCPGDSVILDTPLVQKPQ